MAYLNMLMYVIVIDICEELRRNSHVPILFASARNAEEDKQDCQGKQAPKKT